MIKSYLIQKYMGIACCALSFGLAGTLANAADHIDLPRSVRGLEQARPDAAITDFYAFVNSRRLVMIINLNPNLDPAVTTYRFPTDVTYRFNVDLDSAVTMGNDVGTREFGGNIRSPASISEDVVFEVTFNRSNQARLNITGRDSSQFESIRTQTRLFAGLRAESFIFSPFARNNIGGIVIEVPLAALPTSQSQLLIWGTATVGIPTGQFVELGARALRSQFVGATGLNALHPSQHVAAGFGRADVVILDVSRPSSFPNGRALSDDVVDEVATFRSLATDPVTANNEIINCLPGGPNAPCPVAGSATADDVRILGRFPYLGAAYVNGR